MAATFTLPPFFNIDKKQVKGITTVGKRHNTRIQKA